MILVKPAPLPSRIDRLVLACSFEERASRLVAALVEAGSEVGALELVRYPLNVEPSIEGRRRYDQQLRFIESASDSLQATLTETFLDPDSYDQVVRLARSIGDANGVVMIDLSCLTRVSVCVFASALPRTAMGIYLGYTVPFKYDTAVGQRQWAGFGLYPLGLAADVGEGLRHLVVLCGHEPSRINSALGSLSPNTVRSIFFRSGSSDLMDIAKRRHRSLRGAWRMLGPTGYLEDDCSVTDYSGLQSLVVEHVASLRPLEAVTLLPYGPKLSSFLAAASLSRAAPTSSFFGYSPPVRYRLGDTVGARDPIVVEAVYSLETWDC